MADEVDMAQEAYERSLVSALAERLNQPTRESNETCKDCGEEIPEARRKAAPGCTRCVSCQENFEN